MIWPFKRTDPLVAKLLDDYNLNLLSPPRERFAVGDLCMTSRNITQRIGSIADFLVPPYQLPRVKHEKLPDISGQVSGTIDANVGFELLGPFLQLIGAVGVESIGSTFDRKNKSTIQFRFPNTTREFIDPIVFAKAIGARQFDIENPLHHTSNRYYAAAGVLRSSAISLVSADDFVKHIESKVRATALGRVSVDRKGQEGTKSEITFTGTRKTLAYGVQLFELARDEDGKWTLGNSGYFKVRGVERAMRFRPPAYARLEREGSDLGVEIGA